MNAFPSDVIYQAYNTRSRELLAEADVERRARTVSSARNGTRWLRGLLPQRRRPEISASACVTASAD